MIVAPSARTPAARHDDHRHERGLDDDRHRHDHDDRCVDFYGGISVPSGSAGIALAVPFSVGAGVHTIRVTFRVRGQVRTLFWTVNLT